MAEYKDITTASGRLRRDKYLLKIHEEEGVVGLLDLIEHMHKMIGHLGEYVAGDYSGEQADPQGWISAAEDAAKLEITRGGQ